MDKAGNLNRRTFIKRSAGALGSAVALPYLVTDTALGGSGATAASNRITIGCIGVGWQGTGNINSDPLFVTGPLGDYYLSQIAAGQAQNSPCVDTGDPASSMIIGTTRTDEIQDSGVVDMGYHYPLP